MATVKDREENMKENYPITKEFFAKIDISRGLLRDRAKLVVDFIERAGTPDRHCCLAMKKTTIYCSSLYGDDETLAQFDNNGIEYVLFRLSKLEEIRDFRKKALRAIEAAEERAGPLVKRKEAFKKAFYPDKANLIIVDRDHGFYSWFSFDNYLWEDRGSLRYYVWVYGWFIYQGAFFSSFLLLK